MIGLNQEQLRVRRAQIRRRQVRGTPRPMEPRGAVMAYTQALNRFAQVVADQIAAKIIEPAVERLAVRQDARDSILGALLAEVLDDLLGSADLKRLAAEVAQIAGRTSRFNLHDLGRVIGVQPPELGQGTILAWAEQNVQLIRSLPENVVRELGIYLATERGFEAGVRAEALVDDIQRITGHVTSRARLIARDQVLKLNAKLTQHRHQAMGVRRYRWSASLDERTRSHHRALDNQIFSWDKPPVGGGTSPSDQGHPGDGILCRCVAAPILEDV